MPNATPVNSRTAFDDEGVETVVVPDFEEQAVTGPTMDPAPAQPPQGVDPYGTYQTEFDEAEYMQYKQNVNFAETTRELQAEFMETEERPVTGSASEHKGTWPTDVHGLPLEDPMPRGPEKPVPQEDWSSWTTWVRGGAEFTKQALGGIEDAAVNTMKLLKPLDDLANWLNDNVADLRYERIAAPKTGAGAFARDATNFLVGFIPATKVLKGIGLASKMGKGGQVTETMVAGAMADFVVRSPDSGRAIELWNKLGLPESDFVNWMEGDEDDTEADMRIKNMLDGVLSGGLAEGVFKAFKMVRGAKRNAPESMKEAKDRLTAAEGVSPEGDLTAKQAAEVEKSLGVLGNKKLPITETVPGTVAAKRKAAAKKAAATRAMKDKPTEKIIDEIQGRGEIQVGKETVYVNYARIESEEDVKQAIRAITESTTKLIASKKGDPLTDKAVRKMADSLGMTVEDILNRPRARAWNPGEVVAARRLWEHAGSQLVKMAEKAGGPNATDIDKFAFRKMVTVFTAINAEIRGASAEASRALRAWGIPTGTAADKARAISNMLEANGGGDSAAFFANKIMLLHKNGRLMTKTGQAVINKMAGARGLDALREVWAAGLLTMPSTHIVNGTSSMMVIAHQLGVRTSAAMFGRGNIAPLEGIVATHAMISSFKDALRAGHAAWKTGDSGFWMNKIDVGATPALSAEAFGVSSNSGIGKAIDAVGHWARTPFRLLGGTDEFFKTIMYRGELSALAYREALSKGLTGDDLTKFMAKTLDEPPRRMRLAAQEAAVFGTFQDKPGTIAKAVIEMRNSSNTHPLMRLAATVVFPFVKTPSRLINYTFEHSPFAMLQSKFQTEFKAGGARREIAVTKMVTGAMAAGTFLDLADSGYITGGLPADPVERAAWLRMGIQPYSMRIGDNWVSYNRTDPLGMVMGFTADLADMMHRYDMDEEDYNEFSEIAGALTFQLGNILINKNYMQGLAKVMDAFQNPQSKGAQVLMDTGASFLPATSLLGGLARAQDPIYREMNTFGDVIKNRIPYLKSTLTPKRDMWGYQFNGESSKGTLWDFFTPFRTTDMKPSPIDTEMLELAQHPRVGPDATLPRKIRKKTSFFGVDVDLKEWPEVYDEYVKLAGHGYKDPATGRGLKEELDLMVQGEGLYGEMYVQMPPALRVKQISSIVRGYRSAAANQLLEDPKNAEFAAWWQMELERKGSYLDDQNPQNFMSAEELQSQGLVEQGNPQSTGQPADLVQ